MAAIEVWFGVIAIILIVLIMLKIVSKKQAAAVKLAIILFVFLMITIGYMTVTYDVDITTFSGLKQAGTVYVTWIGSIFKNMGKISTFAFQQEWGLDSAINSTMADKTPSEEP